MTPSVRRGAAALALAVLAAACGGGDPSAAGSVPALRVTGVPSLPTTVDALPDIDPAGYDRLLADLEGTPVVVNFWATWCEPCVREMPLLADAARRFDGQVQFVGIDISDARDPARTFVRETGIPYPNLFDVTGSVKAAVGAVGQPATVFYAPDGTGTLVDGELSAEALDRELAAIAPD
jgi:thiol-disulfide isomerase/thioredoxin